MPDRPTAERTARLLLRYYREPARLRAEALQADAPALDDALVLKLALGQSIEFDEAALNRLRTTVLRDAAASYVRRVYFRADATPYQTLGVGPDATQEAIKDNFRLLMQLVHPDRQDPRLRWPDSCAAQANRAYGMLKNEASRASYDRDEAARARAARAAVTTLPMSAATRWPAQGGATARPSPEPVLPAWLTEGVGGFVRRHPATVVFSVLLAGAAAVIGTTLWDSEAGSLTRDERQAQAPVPAQPSVTAPAPEVAAVPAATRVAAAPSRNAAPAGASAETKVWPERSVATPVAPALPRTQAPAVVALAPASPSPIPSSPVPAPASPSPGAASPSSAPAAPSPTSVAAVAPVSSAPTPASVPRVAEPAHRTEPLAPVAAPAAEGPPPTSAEIEALFSAFVESYDRGRIDAFAALFDDAAESNLHRGRAAIRGEYNELFQLSSWRRMQLTRINWKRVDGRTVAKGEIAVKIAWRDGREVEQQIAVDMEMARRDGRLLITRLSHQPRTR